MHRSAVSHTWPQTHPNLPQGTTHPNLPQGKELVTKAKWHQPPPSLPRRGGTDTIDRLTVIGLSPTRVTCIATSGNNSAR